MSTDNDWFFNAVGPWSTLNEEGKYALWSAHVSDGGSLTNYPEFCDTMDAVGELGSIA